MYEQHGMFQKVTLRTEAMLYENNGINSGSLKHMALLLNQEQQVNK